MPSLLPLPKQDVPITDATNLVPAKSWYDWFVRLQKFSANAEIAERLKIGTTPSQDDGSTWGADLNTFEFFRVEGTNTNANATDGYYSADDVQAFVRMFIAPSGVDPGGFTRNAFLAEAFIPAGFSVASGVVAIQGVALSGGTHTGNLVGVFSDTECYPAGGIANNVQAFVGVVDNEGAAINGTAAAFTGHVINTSGNPVNTQTGIELTGSGANVTNRYQILLGDWTGTPSGNNYGVLQRGTNRKNLFNAQTTVGSADQQSVDGALPLLGTVNLDGAAVWDTLATTWSTTSGGVGGFGAAYSRNATVGAHTIVQSGDVLASVSGYGSDGSTFQPGVRILLQVDGAPGAGSMPGMIRLFTTPSGSAIPTESQRIDHAGAIYFPRVGTTASAANAFLNNASSPANSLLRSTSSLRYKADVSEVPQQRLDALRALRPIEYRSLAPADNPDTRFVGYTAEDVAAIDPALVATDSEGRPDGVMYDRVLLLQVAALQADVDALKTRLM